MKRERLTKRNGDGVQYDNGEYIVTCYPKNNNLTKIDEMAVRLCELEEKITAAAEIKHGKNVTKNHPVDEFICSECGAMFRDVPLIVVDEDDGDELYYEFAFKYCPWCGAKIDY